MKRIDINAAIRQKYKGFLPRFLVKWIERVIRQDELNRMMALQDHVGGVEMAHRVMDDLNITTELIGAERLPDADTRALFVCNHPLGGADGIILTALLGDHYNGQIKVMVNDLLLNVFQFEDVFVPVNKYGSQGRKHLSTMEDALNGDAQVLTFPAGFCSRTDDKGEIRDIAWRSSFVRMAMRHGRVVVPLFFEGENSTDFYKWANRRKKAGIKFNYELVLLPRELLNAKDKHFRIFVGEPIAIPDLPQGKEINAFVERLQSEIYTYPALYDKE